MARPNPCLGCGTKLDDAGGLTLDVADPLHCVSGKLNVKIDGTTIQTDGQGRLRAVATTSGDSYYPALFAEASPAVYPDLVTGSFIENATTGNVSLLPNGNVSISITNPTDRPYMAHASWKYTPVFISGSVGADYWIGPNLALLKNSVSVSATGPNDGMRYARFLTGALNLRTEISAITGLFEILPGETFGLDGNISMSIASNGNNVTDALGITLAYFRVEAHPR